MNGDGKEDLLWAQPNDMKLAVALGNGMASFGTATLFACGGRGPRDMAIADVNQDGKLDVAVSNEADNNLSILLGDGSGGFEMPRSFPTVNNYPTLMAVRDVNGDNRPDIIVVTSISMSVLFNQSQKSESAHPRSRTRC